MLTSNFLKPVVFSLTSALVFGTSSIALAADQATETSPTVATTAPADTATKPDDQIIVATVNGSNVTLADAKEFHKTLPPQVAQLPLALLFDKIVDHLVTIKIANEKGIEEGIDKDPKVINELNRAKAEIIQGFYIEKLVNDAITEEKLQDAYKKHLLENPPQKEAHAKHILVNTEEKAKEIIQELDDGANFEDLANKESQDTAAQEDNGGDLGWFTAETMVKPFADAAFKMKKGTYSKEPVKTRFGYHIIKLEDFRMAEQPTYEEIKETLRGQLHNQLIEKIITDMIDSADVQRFDMHGNPVAASQEGAADEAPTEEK